MKGPKLISAHLWNVYAFTNSEILSGWPRSWDFFPAEKSLGSTSDIWIAFVDNSALCIYVKLCKKKYDYMIRGGCWDNLFGFKKRKKIF